MENIPTAEEFLNEKYNVGLDCKSHMSDHLKEFAKLHVKEALEKVAKEVVLVENMRTNGLQFVEDNKFDNDKDFYIRRDSILNAYPEDLIK